MKTLTLLRHAKSSWDDPVGRDFDRPLNPRGKRAARTVGQKMRSEGLVFDRVLASPATRVVETLSGVGDGYGPGLEAEFDRRIYLAPASLLLDLIHAVDDAIERLLLVGHNPGLEMLALMLSRQGALREEIEVKYPTGSLAEISLPVDHWADASAGTGSLVRFVRPRDLDPELGPDPE